MLGWWWRAVPGRSRGARQRQGDSGFGEGRGVLQNAPRHERDDRETHRRRKPGDGADIPVRRQRDGLCLHRYRRISGKGARLSAHFSNQKGELVDSAAKTIKPKGRENTELHAVRAKGWTPGTYRITVYADGDSVDSKTFAVQK